MSLGKLHLPDDAFKELAPLHELDDDVVVLRVILEELIDLDYIRVLQVSQSVHLTEAHMRNRTKVTQFCSSRRFHHERAQEVNTLNFRGSFKRGGKDVG